MRTIGVSWLTKDWIASTRFTFGTRSTIRISTRSIAAITYLRGHTRSLPPCGGGLGRGVAQTSKVRRFEPLYLERSARPPSPALPQKGGGTKRRGLGILD